MAKSLPSLSSYLANNRHSALFGTDETVLDQVSTMVNHDGVIRVNSNRKKKGFFTSVEDAHDSGITYVLLIKRYNFVNEFF